MCWPGLPKRRTARSRRSSRALWALALWLGIAAAASPARAQNQISVPFPRGFIGTRGSSAGTADDVLTYTTLGISRTFFIQSSSKNEFELQGNDIPGTLRIVRTDGTTLDIPASANWRNSGGTTSLIGILPRPASPITFAYPGGSIQITNGSNPGGSSVGGYTAGHTGSVMADGGDESGNAAQAQVLGALNEYLTSVVASRPAGPVTVTAQTTSNTRPTIAGTATLAGGEGLSIVVAGVEYTSGTSPAVALSGTSWSLTLTSALALGTHSVTATITDGDGFTLSDGTTNELVIGSPTVTIGGSFSANDKTYDGTTSATGTTSGLTLSGIANGHDVTIASVTLGFASASAGTGRTVSVHALTLGGAHGGQYAVSLAGAPTATATITAKRLTVGGSITVPDKVYDGTTAATISGVSISLNGVVVGDAPSLSGMRATFADAAVGAGKTVSLSQAGLSGTAAANYTLDLTGAPSTTASITPKPVSVGGVSAVSRAYDGTTVATLTGTATYTGLAAGDSFTPGGTPTASFASAAIGTGKAVSVTGFAPPSANYTLTQPTGLTANVTARPLTVGGSFTAPSRPYDGTTAAAIGTNGLTLVGVVSGETVTLGGESATFATAAAGTGKTLSLAGGTLGGADAGNYTLSLAGAPTTTADITAKVLTLGGSFTAADKVSDGTTAATISANALTLLGIVGGDVVSLSGPTASFADAAVGAGKPVTLSAASLTGAAATNYALSLAGAPTTTANITSAGGTVTISGTLTANDRVYDGTTGATGVTSGLTLVGVTNGDQLSIASVTLGFQTSAAGAGKTVVITAVTLGGANAAQYTTSLAGAPTATASVTPRSAGITGVVAVSRVYDGTTTVALAGTPAYSGLAAGESFAVAGTASASVASAAVGAGKAVTVSGFAAPSANYTLQQPTGLVADVTARTVTLAGSLAASGKPFDGTATASISVAGLTLVGVLPGDAVTLGGAAAAFADPTAGAAKSVTLTAATLAGAASGNYALSLAGAPTATAAITAPAAPAGPTAPAAPSTPSTPSPAALTVRGSLAAHDKVYDATTVATGSAAGLVLAGVGAGHDVGIAGVTLAFQSPAVGGGRAVVLTGVTLAGVDAHRYAVSLAGAPAATARITARPLTLGGSFTAADKVYDGTVAATTASSALQLVGTLAGDAVALGPVAVTFADPAVGTGKRVAVSGASLSGASAANYALSLAGAPAARASILAAAPPSAPRAVAVTPGDGRLTVTWAPPDSAGCRAPTGYVVEYTADEARGWQRVTVAATPTSATLAGLLNQLVYRVRVAAVDPCGTGAFAAAAPVAPEGPARDGGGRPTPAAPGAVGATVGGTPRAVTTTVVQDTVVRVAGDDFTLRLRALDEPGAAIPVDSTRALALEQGGRAVAEGSGFAPGSRVTLYLVSPAGHPLLLGAATVDPAGAFSGVGAVPSALAAGDYTLQVNGIDAAARPRSVALGVEVAPPPPELALAALADDPRPAAGDTVTLTLTVTNTGRGAAIDVVIPRAFREPGFAVVRTTPVDGTYRAATQEWAIPRIEPGARARLLLTAVVLPPPAAQPASVPPSPPQP